MFKKILIANRGEIAVRIIRACRELGISPVTVYSEADRRALHVRMADEAVRIGPSNLGESYLKIENVLQAAIQIGADAIHPGYGFLSENAEFAKAVQKAGLIFIGPPPEAIRLMGDKGKARQRMQSAGVPVIPGYQGENDLNVFHSEAGKIGYPILVKAATGGGGKGMRVVRQESELDESVAAAQREALHAFGDSRLILEQYIPNARHIEFQILADHHGNILHFYERECSIQRRHQKIIEETPATILDDDLRSQMGAAAISAAASVGYQNAGTVEFIFNPRSRSFYFLEMNTRLQVEHPITEFVTGIDLAQWQIRIASGERLPFSQAQIIQRGHAIECRLYAEDPSNGFLPFSGRLLRFIEPKGPGVRVDSGVASGDEITVHYDPLIAKLIAYAADRPSAIRKMKSALEGTVLLGLTTNALFLQDVLSHPEFQSGDIYTTWVEERLQDWQPPQCSLPPEVIVAAALTEFPQVTLPPSDHLSGQEKVYLQSGRDPFTPWQIGNSYRVGE